MQILNWKKKPSKNHTKISFEGVLGSIWEGFRAVSLFWALLAASWSFFEHSKSSFFQALAQDGLQGSFWINLGPILEGFREDLGGFWADFHPFLAAFGKVWARKGKIWKNLERTGAESLNSTPALIREASLFNGLWRFSQQVAFVRGHPGCWRCQIVFGRL